MHGRCIIGCTWRSSRGCCNCRVPPHAGTVPLVASSHRAAREIKRCIVKREMPRRGAGDPGPSRPRVFSSGSRARFRRLGFLLHKGGGESIEGRSIEEQHVDGRRARARARAFLDLFSSSIFFRPRVVHVSLRFGGTLTRREREREREREGGAGEDGRGFTWGPRPPSPLRPVYTGRSDDALRLAFTV